MKTIVGIVGVAAFLSVLLSVGASLEAVTPAFAGPLEDKALADGQGAYQNHDYATAERLLGPLAEGGSADAQLTIGAMYLTGKGVTQDPAEALRWFQRAADQGLADARSLLGFMYASGRGAPQDSVRAYVWYSLAAGSFPESAAESRNAAMAGRDAIATKMTPAQIAQAQKMVREWRPKGKDQP
ncbi:MAG: sel1 repeat family protein [Nitrospirota bacterium]|nr:sel1 repeat family protein [Nitrospirota bacterium]